MILSLKEEITEDSMMKIIQQQREVLDKKLKSFKQLSPYIEFLDFRIKEVEKTEIFIKENDEK